METKKEFGKAKEIAENNKIIRLIPCYDRKESGGKFLRYEEADSYLDCLRSAREMAEWQKGEVMDKSVEFIKELCRLNNFDDSIILHNYKKFMENNG